MKVVGRVLRALGFSPLKLFERAGFWSIRASLFFSGRDKMVRALRKVVPDISDQEECEKNCFSPYLEVKRRGMHAFQCGLMLRAVDKLSRRKDAGRTLVVDIGDSAGTHMRYLKELTKSYADIDALSVNLDERAIAKIKAKGMKALLCRAENLNVDGYDVDLFTSFEMVEHLHDPVRFLRRLAKSGKGEFLLTVPYLRQSRVGLHHIRQRSVAAVRAEDVHVFELSPADWRLLFMHAGWRVCWEETYLQYPAFLAWLMGWFWRRFDYEGFWGVMLTRDPAYAEAYKDWAE